MQENYNIYPVSFMAEHLKVSRAGYYNWRSRQASPSALRRLKIKAAIEEIYYRNKKRYGAPRIAIELKAMGIRCSKNHVAAILHNAGLRARNGKSFRYTTRYEARINLADNLLKRNFNAERPNQKWTTDITYIWVNGRWLYLAAVMDLYSRAIVGWAMDRNMTEDLVCEALHMAFENRAIGNDLIIHSDRGVQFRSNVYRKMLTDRNIKRSMSRVANCWDNAAMESFFSRLKVELIYAETFNSITQAKSAVFEYIEIYYNRQRRHSAIGYISPVQFEKKCA
jgi:transposase InsO family protein